ncbi:MAG: hypothetical protein LUG52_04715 [Clostridia bacterium]|nr:hypothetical protein [Clostridia bacterium]
MTERKKINIKEIQNRSSQTQLTTPQALKDVTPFAFSESVLNGKSFNELIDFISEGDFETQHITDNL